MIWHCSYHLAALLFSARASATCPALIFGAARTGALWFGLSWPVGELVGEFLIGVLITVLAAFLPAIRATRVAPLEALRPVE